MSQKICFIAMQFGFVGSLALGDGKFANINHTSESYEQFELNPSVSYSKQIQKILARMYDLAKAKHMSESKYGEENFGSILTQNIVITDHPGGDSHQ